MAYQSTAHYDFWRTAIWVSSVTAIFFATDSVLLKYWPSIWYHAAYVLLFIALSRFIMNRFLVTNDNSEKIDRDYDSSKIDSVFGYAFDALWIIGGILILIYMNNKGLYLNSHNPSLIIFPALMIFEGIRGWYEKFKSSQDRN